MIVFLKRLVGMEEDQVREGERFKRNLNGFDTRQKELDGIERQLTQILDSVEEQKDSIRARPSSHMSGEHALNLNLGEANGEDGAP